MCHKSMYIHKQICNVLTLDPTSVHPCSGFRSRVVQRFRVPHGGYDCTRTWESIWMGPSSQTCWLLGAEGSKLCLN